MQDETGIDMTMQRTIGRKIALGFSITSVVGAVAIVLLLAVNWITGNSYPGLINGSLMASVFFLVSCAVVLYFMSKPSQGLARQEHGGN